MTDTQLEILSNTEITQFHLRQTKQGHWELVIRIGDNLYGVTEGTKEECFNLMRAYLTAEA